MRLKISERVGGHAWTVNDASMLIVEDYLGNPVVVIRQVTDLSMEIVTADDGDEFNNILRGLGIDKTVISDRITIDQPLPANATLIAGPGLRL